MGQGGAGEGEVSPPPPDIVGYFSKNASTEWLAELLMLESPTQNMRVTLVPSSALPGGFVTTGSYSHPSAANQD